MSSWSRQLENLWLKALWVEVKAFGLFEEEKGCQCELHRELEQSSNPRGVQRFAEAKVSACLDFSMHQNHLGVVKCKL